MKLNDDTTMSIAASVSAVLEGKKEVKEMDPKKHVSKDGEKFIVKNPKGDVLKSFDDEDAAVKYATDNHDDIMAEAGEPEAKGEKDFKDAHKVKKTVHEGELPPALKAANAKKKAEKVKEEEDEDEKKDVKEATVKKEGNAFTKALNAARENGDSDFVVSGKKYKVEDYDQDEDEDEDKKKVNEASAKQEKYKKFFDAALKKFGVKSPAELEGDKKKEFFDYVDKNYEAENESD